MLVATRSDRFRRAPVERSGNGLVVAQEAGVVLPPWDPTELGMKTAIVRTSAFQEQALMPPSSPREPWLATRPSHFGWVSAESEGHRSPGIPFA